MKKESFKKGITDGIPIALGYLAVSFTFGIMAVKGGLDDLAGSSAFPDQSDLCRTVCRS